MDDENFICISILAPVTAVVLIGSILYIRNEWNRLKLQMIRNGKYYNQINSN